MCYDQEKTQGVDENPLRREVEEKLRHSMLRETAGGQIAGANRRPMSEDEILAELFRYHTPTPNSIPKYAAVNQAAKNFAEIILQNCPPCADRSAAIRQIREARATANAAIALNGLSL